MQDDSERPVLRRAILIGAAGQDGHYLGLHLEALGYEVMRVYRDRLQVGQTLRPFSIFDAEAVKKLFATYQPHEAYYLAAYHHSSQEELEPLTALFEQSFRVHCFGLLNCLEAIANESPSSRLFYSASSRVFGNPDHAPQTETTPMAPICAYGVTKSAGIGICRVYRLSNGVFCSGGILYNHESPRRSEKFVSRKISRAVAAIHAGRISSVTLGSLDAKVDWSAAEDVVQAMHLALQADNPDDYVIASGTLRSVREFAERAFSIVGLDYRKYVLEAAATVRPMTSLVPIQGDTSRIRMSTGWRPSTTFEDLVEKMVRAELDEYRA